MDNSEPVRVLRIPVFAKAAGRSRQSVYEDIKAGRIPVVRLGPRALRIPAQFLEQLVASAMAKVRLDEEAPKK
jgi:predicted DNA-binding transcriptional regulator AlpA